MINIPYDNEEERETIKAAEEAKGNRCRKDRITAQGPPLRGELTFLEPAEIPEDDREFAEKRLRATDADMARIGEDILTALINRGVLSLEDLPPRAQEKLTLRAELRARM